MNIAVIDYKAGNVYSVVHALQRLGANATLTDNPETIASADKVLFPGQGNAEQAMRQLQENGLDKLIPQLQQPVLGICIGQQLLCRHSDEGNVDCLGIFDAPVVRFMPEKHEEKIPHMGWNSLSGLKSELFREIDEGNFVYFIHSFYVPTCPWTIATCDYIVPFSAAMHKDNFYATQFHPEKSGSVGEQILRNFLNL